MFKYIRKEDNKFYILDTSDGETEGIDSKTLRQLLNNGVKIEGLSFNDEGNVEDAFGDVVDEFEIQSNKNKNLSKAKKAKNDEFYTQLSDIEKELSHYPKEYFKDKTIYCPTDVAINTGAIKQSQFVKYFQMHAHDLQFKRLIATCLVDKAQAEGEDIDSVQNCYVLERQSVPMQQRNIYGYENGQGTLNPVIDEISDFGMKYKTADGKLHPVPYHIVNQAITDANGRIVIVKRYIDHYDPETGKPILGVEDKGCTWKFKDKTLSIKWCRLFPDGKLDPLPNECYFFNNNDIISDFSLFPKDVNENPCYENVEGGSVCLYPAEYYDFVETDYSDFNEYYIHCPSDGNYVSGDFRSEYCTSLLKESDIVVTNPPFSLFRDFFKWLMDNEKDFIIVGNQNAITYKEVFPYLKEDKVRMGSQHGVKTSIFEIPSSDYKYDEKLSKDLDPTGIKHYGKVAGVAWFTNLKHDKFKEPLLITERYSSEKYPKYVNYNAIEVSKVDKIPCDYNEIMGVPITYMYYHNPDQFEIIGNSLELCKKMSEIANKGEYMQGGLRPYIELQNGDYKYKRMYDRIFIRRKINK